MLVFSLFSGTFYDILEKDFSLLDIGQIPLKKQPNANCSKCYGRGYTGRNSENLTYSICNCTKKHIDYELIKNAKQST